MSLNSFNLLFFSNELRLHRPAASKANLSSSYHALQVDQNNILNERSDLGDYKDG